MLIDARQLHSNEVITSDVCIVGAGPAGITLCRELIAKRIDVCLLESGGSRQSRSVQALAAGQNVGAPYFPLHRARARYFGGSSNYWLPNPGVKCRPLEDEDFERRSWVPYSGWPFGKPELDKHYERAHGVMQLGRPYYNMQHWPTAPEGRLPLDDSLVHTSIFHLGPVDAFRKYLPDMAHSPRARVVLNAHVLDLEASVNSPTISHVRFATASGYIGNARARYYVLATGGIENPRLLLLSTSRYLSGIGNHHDLVGRFFMEHPHLPSGYVIPPAGKLPQLGIYKEQLVGDTRVMGALSINSAVQETAGLGRFTAFLQEISPATASSRAVRSFKDIWRTARYRRRGQGTWRQVAGHLRNVLARPDEVGAFAASRLASPSSTPVAAVEFMAVSEQVPNPNSRVSLDTSRDRFGKNRVQLCWRLTDQDMRTIRASQDILDRALQRAGFGPLRAKYAEESPPPTISGGWHHMGTTRMHNDPKHGVVDAHCRVHGIENLFVAGSSVFPTGGDANPTLTVVALALRLAAHLEKRSRSVVRL